MRLFWNILKNIILWSHARGTIPYDILCGLILIFIFLTPRSVFKDWPVYNNPHQFELGEQIVRSLDEAGNPVINVSKDLVPIAADWSTIKNRVKLQIQKVLGKPVNIADIRPIIGEKGETIGYSVWLAQDSDAF